MIFADMLANTSVFIDANVFVYHFTNNAQYGPASGDFLARVSNGELRGLTSATILGENKVSTITRFGAV